MFWGTANAKSLFYGQFGCSYPIPEQVAAHALGPGLLYLVVQMQPFRKRSTNIVKCKNNNNNNNRTVKMPNNLTPERVYRESKLSKVLLRNPENNFYHTEISFPLFKLLKSSWSSTGNSPKSLSVLTTNRINLQFLHHHQSLFAEELAQYVFKLQSSTTYAQKSM